MKKIFASLLLVVFAAVGVYAQGAKFQFTAGDSYDFGTVKDGEKVVHVYEFKNVGDQPLMIQRAEAGCSCTSADWTKTPVMPGKTGIVKVTFDSKDKVGPAMKEITIKSNAVLPNKNMARYSIFLKGKVVAK